MNSAVSGMECKLVVVAVGCGGRGEGRGERRVCWVAVEVGVGVRYSFVVGVDVGPNAGGKSIGVLDSSCSLLRMSATTLVRPGIWVMCRSYSWSR